MKKNWIIKIYQNWEEKSKGMKIQVKMMMILRKRENWIKLLKNKLGKKNKKEKIKKMKQICMMIRKILIMKKKKNNYF